MTWRYRARTLSPTVLEVVNSRFSLGRANDLSASEAPKKRRRELDAPFTLVLPYDYGYRRRASIKVPQAWIHISCMRPGLTH